MSINTNTPRRKPGQFLIQCITGFGRHKPSSPIHSGRELALLISGKRIALAASECASAAGLSSGCVDAGVAFWTEVFGEGQELSTLFGQIFEQTKAIEPKEEIPLSEQVKAIEAKWRDRCPALFAATTTATTATAATAAAAPSPPPVYILGFEAEHEHLHKVYEELADRQSAYLQAFATPDAPYSADAYISN